VSDERLRRLEREVALGDPEAEARLVRERARTLVPDMADVASDALGDLFSELGPGERAAALETFRRQGEVLVQALTDPVGAAEAQDALNAQVALLLAGRSARAGAAWSAALELWAHRLGGFLVALAKGAILAL
jgi:hypothetical protein